MMRPQVDAETRTAAGVTVSNDADDLKVSETAVREITDLQVVGGRGSPAPRKFPDFSAPADQRIVGLTSCVFDICVARCLLLSSSVQVPPESRACAWCMCLCLKKTK